MDILQNLPSCFDKGVIDTLWKYNERQDLYNKYSQYTSEPIIEEKKTEFRESKQLLYNIVPKEVDNETSHTTKVEQHKEIEDKVVAKNQSNIPKEQLTKSKKSSPMQVIIQLSHNTDANTVYIKDKLIELISAKYFHTAFGVKKSSDVMKGISENKWNKSYALLVSFLFDVSFVYLNKVVSYYPEKTYDTVITI